MLFLWFLRRHQWKLCVSLFVFLTMCGVYARKEIADAGTVVAVTRGDVRETIRAVGIVTEDQDIQVRFTAPGIVGTVLVREGDTVTKGQTLASLRSDGLDGSRMTALSSLQAAQLQLDALRGGARPEDMAVLQAQKAATESDLVRARQKLEAAREALTAGGGALPDARVQAATRLEGEVTLGNGVVTGNLSTAKTALMSLQNVLSRLDVQDALIKYSPGAYEALNTRQRWATQTVESVSAGITPANDAVAALENLRRAREAVTLASDALDEGALLLASLPNTQHFDAAGHEAVIAILGSQQSQLQSMRTSIDRTVTGIQEAMTAVGTAGGTVQQVVDTAAQQAVQNAQAEVEALEAVLNINAAQIRFKTAPPSAADITQAELRVRQAQTNLDRIATQYGDTTIVAPADGTVSRVNLTPGQPAPAIESAINIRTVTLPSVLVYFPEDDIARMDASVTGFILFDAFPGERFALDTDGIKATVVRMDGIDTFRKLALRQPKSGLVTGATGNVTIVLDERKNVITVPAGSIENDEDGKQFVRVRRENDIVRQPVVTGLHGENGTVEILRGLRGDESLIIP